MSLLAATLSVLVTLAAAEGSARLYWRLRHGVPLRRSDLVLYGFYPGLVGIDRARPSRRDGVFDVLLLGGSTLHPGFGAVEHALREHLAAAGVPRIRIHNLAVPGQTSRDAVFQYQAVGEARFDLVVVYHGINDSRMNNAPPDVFRADYSHFGWYRVLDRITPYHRNASFALGYTLRYLLLQAEIRWWSGRYAPFGAPRGDWVAHGATYRSVEPFRANLLALMDRAEAAGDRLVLMTVATHVPADYSFERFRAKQLDYTLHLSPLELWGEPQNVLGAVRMHNEVVRELARGKPTVVLVDQERLMPPGRRFYNDAWHLTVEGAGLFAGHLVDALEIRWLPRDST